MNSIDVFEYYRIYNRMNKSGNPIITVVKYKLSEECLEKS